MSAVASPGVDLDTLYVLEDDTTECGECLEDTQFDLEPPHRQIHCRVTIGQCWSCGKNFNNGGAV